MVAVTLILMSYMDSCTVSKNKIAFDAILISCANNRQTLYEVRRDEAQVHTTGHPSASSP